MTFSDTCDIVPGITRGVCKSAKRHIVYIDNPREIIIITIGSHYDQLISSIIGWGNGGCVSRGGHGNHHASVMFTQKRTPSDVGGNAPAPVDGKDGQTKTDIMCYKCNKTGHMAYF